MSTEVKQTNRHRGDTAFLSLKQAHAKVWHTYDMQWRSKQKGKKKKTRQHNFILVEFVIDKFPRCLTVKLLCVSRPGWDLANGRLGGTRGHHQPEGH